MSESEVLGQEPRFAALVGIDWADQKHAWCLQAAGTTQRESGEVEHTPEAVEAWVGQLCQRFGNRPIAVAVEQMKGSLVFMLSKYEPLHLYPVPPAMSANLREALYPSGAKDDPRDADLLVDLLLQHRDKLRRLSPDSEATRRVQNLVRWATHFVQHPIDAHDSWSGSQLRHLGQQLPTQGQGLGLPTKHSRRRSNRRSGFCGEVLTSPTSSQEPFANKYCDAFAPRTVP